jgi:hypothetical protein
MRQSADPPRQEAHSAVNYLLFLLTLVCFIALVLAFFVVFSLNPGYVWRELLLGLISNVAAATLVFIIIYVSISKIRTNSRAMTSSSSQ